MTQPNDPSAPVWAPQPALEPVSAAALPVAAAPSRRRRGGGGTAFLVVGAIVLVGGLGFAAGRVTAPAATSRAAAFSGVGNGTLPSASGVPGQAGAGDLRRGGLLGVGSGITVEGTVTAVATDAITLDVNGTSTAVKTDASTTYHSQAAGTAADVTVGAKVLVRMSGFGGRAAGGGQGGPRASSAPVASGAAGAPGGALGGAAPTLTATDVTIAAQ
jgi:hypothetical protein